MTRLMVFTGAWVIGILSTQASLFSPIWLLLTIPTALVLVLGWGDDLRVRKLAWFLTGLLLGTMRFWLAQPAIDPSHIAYYNGVGTVTVTGVVVSEPDPRPTYTNLRLAAEELVFANGNIVPVSGAILVKAPPYADVNYGDLIHVSGALIEPPVYGEFSYKGYLAQQGIYALLRNGQQITVSAEHQANLFFDYLLRFKAHTHQVLLRLLPEPQASLLSGILLGIESGIPEDLEADFSITGTSHIVAISGFNLTLIAGVFAALAQRFAGRKWQSPLALTGLWVYTLLVGASAAVLRSAVMASLLVIARHNDRRVHGPTSLAAATWFLSLLNPYVLWDVGFQLSFAATLGLILYTDPLTQYFERLLTRLLNAKLAKYLVTWLNDAFIVTLAAQVLTQPVILGHYQRLSLVTLLTNLLILPAQSFVMVFGGIALGVACLIQPAGQWLSWLAWVFLTYTIKMVSWTAEIPYASVAVGKLTLPVIWGYYSIVALITWWAGLRPSTRQQWLRQLFKLKGWQLAAGAAGIVISFAMLYARPDGKLHVVFFDVGNGDACFIQTPAGKQILIDGGAEGPPLLSQLGRWVPFWDHDLDLVVLTSPDKERVAGLVPVLERYQVDYVLQGGEVGDGAIYQRWLDLLAARPPGSVGQLSASNTWTLDTGVVLHVLWPEPANMAGPLVLKVAYGDKSILLAGDATTVVERELV
ncbi:MAG: ComEC/Rec2 family competence protein, partial [Anaerolineae bacterium]|nr:ComEC/Rec2 family competence protein [Anaerolineae bacterium]